MWKPARTAIQVLTHQTGQQKPPTHSNASSSYTCHPLTTNELLHTNPTEQILPTQYAQANNLHVVFSKQALPTHYAQEINFHVVFSKHSLPTQYAQRSFTHVVFSKQNPPSKKAGDYSPRQNVVNK